MKEILLLLALANHLSSKPRTRLFIQPQFKAAARNLIKKGIVTSPEDPVDPDSGLLMLEKITPKGEIVLTCAKNLLKGL